MLLQTNSYIVPADKRTEHQRLLRRFRQAMARIGCDSFDVFEQVGPNWGGGDTSGRFVQIMRFRDRKHQMSVQAAERNDPTAQALIAEFCELINLPYQQQQGLFIVGFYRSVIAASETAAQPAEQPFTEEEAPAETEFVETEVPAEPEMTDDTQPAAHQEIPPEEEIVAQAPADDASMNPPPLDEIDIAAIADEELNLHDPAHDNDNRRG